MEIRIVDIRGYIPRIILLFLLLCLRISRRETSSAIIADFGSPIQQSVDLRPKNVYWFIEEIDIC